MILNMSDTHSIKHHLLIVMVASFAALFIVVWGARLAMKPAVVAIQKPQVLHIEAPKKIASDYQLPPIENGLVPVITRIPTEKKVVFLTIDDGAYKEKDVISEVEKNNVVATIFLSKIFIGNKPDFFTQLQKRGMPVENHTISHDINMSSLGYDEQKAEICGMAEYIQQQYGRRPLFFRPPGGAYSDTMRQAAADCGMKALITWEAKANGGSMQYQVGDHLRPGDIVLMHFRPEFRRDLKAFIDAQRSAGLTMQLLEDWLQAPVEPTANAE